MTLGNNVSNTLKRTIRIDHKFLVVKLVWNSVYFQVCSAIVDQIDFTLARMPRAFKLETKYKNYGDRQTSI